MLIDILFIICLLAGFISGFSRGFIRALFSFVGLFIGVLIALKYSYVVSDYLYEKELIQSRFLPLISFVFAIAIILLLLYFASRLVEGIAAVMFLGGINKVIGGILEAAIVIIIFSVVLWYLDQMHYLPSEIKSGSFSFRHLVNLAPAVISFVNQILPFFGDVFEQLKQLFEKQSGPYTNGVLV